MNKYIIITTINEKTKAIEEFANRDDWTILLVGDKKSKAIENKKNLIFLSVEDQKALGYKFVDCCPYNHYARKNIGYLYAIKNGADIIADTDDDNRPYKTWSAPSFKASNVIKSDERYFNIYSYFTDKKIWPRGYPLDEINKTTTYEIKDKCVGIGVWQGLADFDPDVDAIYRLIFNDRIKFNDKDSIALDKHLYAPFNSQNTFWKPQTFPYMYLPTTTSFRFTDILRGYIAQRLLWEHDLYLGFADATVYQERNLHDLMRDFSDEIECYLNIKGIVNILESLNFKTDPCYNLKLVYKELAKKNYINDSELQSLDAWLNDFRK